MRKIDLNEKKDNMNEAKNDPCGMIGNSTSNKCDDDSNTNNYSNNRTDRTAASSRNAISLDFSRCRRFVKTEATTKSITCNDSSNKMKRKKDTVIATVPKLKSKDYNNSCTMSSQRTSSSSSQGKKEDGSSTSIVVNFEGSCSATQKRKRNSNNTNRITKNKNRRRRFSSDLFQINSRPPIPSFQDFSELERLEREFFACCSSDDDNNNHASIIIKREKQSVPEESISINNEVLTKRTNDDEPTTTTNNSCNNGKHADTNAVHEDDDDDGAFELLLLSHPPVFQRNKMSVDTDIILDMGQSKSRIMVESNTTKAKLNSSSFSRNSSSSRKIDDTSSGSHNDEFHTNDSNNDCSMDDIETNFPTDNNETEFPSIATSQNATNFDAVASNNNDGIFPSDMNKDRTRNESSESQATTTVFTGSACHNDDCRKQIAPAILHLDCTDANNDNDASEYRKEIKTNAKYDESKGTKAKHFTELTHRKDYENSNACMNPKVPVKPMTESLSRQKPSSTEAFRARNEIQSRSNCMILSSNSPSGSCDNSAVKLSSNEDMTTSNNPTTSSIRCTVATNPPNMTFGKTTEPKTMVDDTERNGGIVLLNNKDEIKAIVKESIRSVDPSKTTLREMIRLVQSKLNMNRINREQKKFIKQCIIQELQNISNGTNQQQQQAVTEDEVVPPGPNLVNDTNEQGLSTTKDSIMHHDELSTSVEVLPPMSCVNDSNNKNDFTVPSPVKSYDICKKEVLHASNDVFDRTKNDPSVKHNVYRDVATENEPNDHHDTKCDVQSTVEIVKRNFSKGTIDDVTLLATVKDCFQQVDPSVATVKDIVFAVRTKLAVIGGDAKPRLPKIMKNQKALIKDYIVQLLEAKEEVAEENIKQVIATSPSNMNPSSRHDARASMSINDPCSTSSRGKDVPTGPGATQHPSLSGALQVNSFKGTESVTGCQAQVIATQPTATTSLIFNEITYDDHNISSNEKENSTSLAPQRAVIATAEAKLCAANDECRKAHAIRCEDPPVIPTKSVPHSMTTDTNVPNVSVIDDMSSCLNMNQEKSGTIVKKPTMKHDDHGFPSNDPSILCTRTQTMNTGQSVQESNRDIIVDQNAIGTSDSIPVVEDALRKRPVRKPRGRPRKATSTSLNDHHPVDSMRQLDAEKASPAPKRQRSRRSSCSLCAKCPCTFSTRDSTGSALSALDSMSKSASEIEKALIKRLQTLEMTADRYDEQREAVRRRLMKHRREMWNKWEQSSAHGCRASVVNTTKARLPRFLPDAEEIDLQRRNGHNMTKRLSTSTIAKAQMNIFGYVPTMQTTLTQMLGTGSGGDTNVDIDHKDDFTSSVEHPCLDEDENILSNDETDGESEVENNCEVSSVQSELKATRVEISDGASRATDGFSFVDPRSLWASIQSYSFHSSFDRLFFEDDAAEAGVDHLLDLIEHADVDAADSGSNGNAHCASPCALSQRGEDLADGIIAKVLAEPSRKDSIEAACPTWKDNVSYALSRKDPDEISDALLNVQHSREKLQQAKEALLKRFEEEGAALCLFEEALTVANSRLVSDVCSSKDRQMAERVGPPSTLTAYQTTDSISKQQTCPTLESCSSNGMLESLSSVNKENCATGDTSCNGPDLCSTNCNIVYFEPIKAIEHGKVPTGSHCGYDCLNDDCHETRLLTPLVASSQ